LISSPEPVFTACMIIRPILTLLPVLALLSGCGFQPMYGSHANAPSVSGGTAEAGLDQIAIAPIPNREGVFLRNALIDRFYRQGTPASPRYDLFMKEIGESKASLDITTSSETTRAQLTQTTLMTLQDRQTGKAVLTRTLTSITSYNILESEFASRVSQENARQSGLDDIARQAELQISLFLNRKPDTAKAP
jgi:LPS-assembly lipoprotein